MSPKGDDRRHPIAEKGGRRSSPQIHSDATAVVHDDGATVIELFDDKNSTPSLRSQKQPARKRAEPASKDPLFDEFWKYYPRHKAKAAAKKAWDKALKNGADPEAVIFGARRYATDPQRAESEAKYTAYPATWLNQERWDDEPDAEHLPAERLSTTDQRMADAQALKARLFGTRPPNVIPGEITR
jgi:hypothetical protein